MMILRIVSINNTINRITHKICRYTNQVVLSQLINEEVVKEERTKNSCFTKAGVDILSKFRSNVARLKMSKA